MTYSESFSSDETGGEGESVHVVLLKVLLSPEVTRDRGDGHDETVLRLARGKNETETESDDVGEETFVLGRNVEVFGDDENHSDDGEDESGDSSAVREG